MFQFTPSWGKTTGPSEARTVDAVRILIVEDDKTLRAVLAELMSEQGYEVEAVGSGEEALTKAMEVAFDLVVTDIRMEGMSGLEALEQMKQHQPDIGSLVVTGYSTEADSIRAIRLGVGEYLKKPFDLSDFLAAVETLLERRRQALALSAKERASERVIGWSVSMLNRALDQELPVNPLSWSLSASQTAELAATVATEMELSAHVVDQIKNACLVVALEQRLENLDLPYEALSPGTRRNVALTTGAPTEGAEPLPMSARIVSASLALARGESDSAADPEIWERLQTAQRLAESAQSPDEELKELESGRKRRGLLSLGRALEGGHLEGARQAYRRVLAESGASRESVEAHLGLVRIAQRSADEVALMEHAREAVVMAAEVGPVTMAWTNLRAGLLAVKQEEEQGVNWIRQADRFMEELRIPSGKALTSLALHAFAGKSSGKLGPSLATLLAPENLSDLAENGFWLIPYLLELGDLGEEGKELVERTLARLARECSRQFQFQLRSQRSSAARRAAVQALAVAGGQIAEETLSLLTQDPDPEVRQAANRALEGRKGANPAPLLRILTLGSFEVYLGEERLDGKWRGKQLSHLMAFLAAQGEKGATEDTIIDAFWPKDAVKGKKNLSSAVSHLRKQLRGSDGRDYLVRTAAGFALSSELPRWHDTEELEKLCDEVQNRARSGEKVAAISKGGQISRLYRGPFLEGCYMEWAVFLRDQLEQKVLSSLLTLSQITLESERFQETMEYTQQVLELDPCLQEAHQLLMKAYLGLGRPEQAVRQFEACQAILRKELGMEPAIALLELHTRAKLSL